MYKKLAMWSQHDNGTEKRTNARSGVAEMGRRSNELSSLANSVCHTGKILVSGRTASVDKCLRSKSCGFTNQAVYLPINHCEGFRVPFGVQLLAWGDVQRTNS